LPGALRRVDRQDEGQAGGGTVEVVVRAGRRAGGHTGHPGGVLRRAAGPNGRASPWTCPTRPRTRNISAADPTVPPRRTRTCSRGRWPWPRGEPAPCWPPTTARPPPGNRPCPSSCWMRSARRCWCSPTATSPPTHCGPRPRPPAPTLYWRMSASFALPVRHVLPGGTYLSELKPARKADGQPIRVRVRVRARARVIEYSVRTEDAEGNEVSELVALATTLLDEEPYPANRVGGAPPRPVAGRNRHRRPQNQPTRRPGDRPALPIPDHGVVPPESWRVSLCGCFPVEGRGVVETRPDPAHRLADPQLAAQFRERIRRVGRAAVAVKLDPA